MNEKSVMVLRRFVAARIFFFAAKNKIDTYRYLAQQTDRDTGVTIETAHTTQTNQQV